MPLFRCCLDRLASTDRRTGEPVEPYTVLFPGCCGTFTPAVAAFDPADLTLTLFCESCTAEIARIVLAVVPRRGGHTIEGAALRATYAHGSGTLELRCADCGEIVAELAVAGGAETN